MRAKVGDYVNYDAGVWETDMAITCAGWNDWRSYGRN